jgi:hypothetical protein
MAGSEGAFIDAEEHQSQSGARANDKFGHKNALKEPCRVATMARAVGTPRMWRQKNPRQGKRGSREQAFG